MAFFAVPKTDLTLCSAREKKSGLAVGVTILDRTSRTSLAVGVDFSSGLAGCMVFCSSGRAGA